MIKDTLFLIPARKGSKGLPGKNRKLLGDKPLVNYSIEFAKNCLTKNDLICVSTNDNKILHLATELNCPAPFIRPENLANDTSTTNEVIFHAINYYKSIGVHFKYIVLLQPTSPFRRKSDYLEMRKIMSNSNYDMVVSVKKTKDNPFFNMYKENSDGLLCSIIDPNLQVSRRQDSPSIYCYNGSIYIIRTKSFLKKKNLKFKSVKKYLMNNNFSIDIDGIDDWNNASSLLKSFDKI